MNSLVGLTGKETLTKCELAAGCVQTSSCVTVHTRHSNIRHTHTARNTGDWWVFSLSLTSVSIFLSLAVSFVDCGGGKARFEVVDSSDFRVNEDGVVYALRHLSMVGKAKAVVVVYAQDLRSKTFWKTRVHLHVHPNSNSAEPGQVKQAH